MLTATSILDSLKYGVTGLLLLIDGIVYWVIGYLFAIFENLAKARLLTQEMYQEFADRIYVIIGVVMLFYLTYALLKSLINPDDLGKNTGKIAINLVTSLVLLGVVPVVFDYAFNIQQAIIDEHVIDNLIFSREYSDFKSSGVESAWSVMSAFINPDNVEIEGKKTKIVTYPWYIGMFVGSGISGSAATETLYSWNEFHEQILTGEVTFLNITDFAEDIHDGKNGVVYTPIISTLSGCFLAYVLISFCIDLGIRVAKLAFYQIIAPIPIIMRILPEKKSVFDNWIKAVLATFMEVFIRMFIMYIVVYLCSVIIR